MQKVFRLIFFCLSLPLSLSAQQQDLIALTDTLTDAVETSEWIEPRDTVKTVEMIALNDTVTTDQKEQATFHPDSRRAVIYALFFPGLGQIYNRKYWKLPIVYGGFLGCIYALNWNGAMYEEYKHGYHDIMLYTAGDESYDYWLKFFAYGTTIDRIDKSNMSYYVRTFKSKRDYFRRYRDLNYFIIIGVYALSVLDAYVDAQLFDFDISPDLSMHIAPVFFERTAYSSYSVGLQCSIRF